MLEFFIGLGLGLLLGGTLGILVAAMAIVAGSADRRLEAEADRRALLDDE